MIWVMNEMPRKSWIYHELRWKYMSPRQQYKAMCMRKVDYMWWNINKLEQLNLKFPNQQLYKQKNWKNKKKKEKIQITNQC